MISLKKEENKQKISNEPYIELSTHIDDLRNPEWSHVEEAIKDVVEEGHTFATLIFVYHDLEIDSIQCVINKGVYRFEGLPSIDSIEYGTIYYIDGLTYEETLTRFKEFYKNQKVTGYKEFKKDKF